jgi:hypothetical protein
MDQTFRTRVLLHILIDRHAPRGSAVRVNPEASVELANHLQQARKLWVSWSTLLNCIKLGV